jgi:uncharacterized membrane protein
MSTTLSPGDTLRCARHRNTETVLRCGRCETPICPRCQIQTPVGARCPTCARVKRFSMLLKPRELALAVAYGIGAAAVGTAIYTFIPFLGPLISFALIGFGVGEAVSIGANRKRVRELAPIAVACLFVGYEVGLVAVLSINGTPLGLGALLVPILAARQLQVIVGLLVGALLAWMRTR